MSANYWASTQWYAPSPSLQQLASNVFPSTDYPTFSLGLVRVSNNWLLDRPQLQLARKEDLRYATRIECAALGVFFSNCKLEYHYSS